MTHEEAIQELKILKEDYWDDDGYGHETIQNDDAMLALEMAIKALEECKTGRWISHIEYGLHGSIQYWVCSECRELYSHDAETGIEITNYRFCPNCGAKMEGAKE